MSTAPAETVHAAPLRALADPGLLAPFLEAKVQATFPKEKPTKAIVVVYVDARAVASILDRTIGPDAWSFQLLQAPMPSDQGWTAHGRLTVQSPAGREVIREDFGTGTGNAEMGGKGAASDALKRCAAQLGVGRALYALEAQTVPCDERKRVTPEAMRGCVERWRVQINKWALQFRAGQAEADAPPAPAEEMPTVVEAPSAGEGHGLPRRQPPASSGAVPPAPPAAGTDWQADLIAAAALPDNKLTRAMAARVMAGKLPSTLKDPKLKKAAVERLREKLPTPESARYAEVSVPIASASRPGLQHEVTLRRMGDETDARCACEAFRFGGACRHIPLAWGSLALSWLTAEPISAEALWEGIDVEALVAAAHAADKALEPKTSAHDEAVADRAFGDEPAPGAAA